MDITKSVVFIEERGSDLEKARMEQILFGRKPKTEVIQLLTALQNNDGGFPYDMVPGNLSSVDTSLVAFWWMDELGILQSPTADKAVDYLLAVQRADGSWDEDASIAQYDLPLWINPGDLRTVIYLSAYAAYWLAVIGYGTQPAFQKALEFLLKHQDETGQFRGYLHSTWIAVSAFRMAGPQYSEVAEKGLQALANKTLADWEASQIAWALDCLGKAGLQENHPLIHNCLAELINRHQPDGSWSSEDGEAFAVGATIGALKVLKWYGRLQA